jgi:OOP family OmpA-OmpF porin
MKAKHLVASLMILFLVSVLTGCAPLIPKSPNLVDGSCTNTNTNTMLKTGDYQKKVDNFLLIQDASSTMSEIWDKRNFFYDSPKIELSKELLGCLNNTLPDNFDVSAGMRVFGPVGSDKGLIYGMDKYSKETFGVAVNSLGQTGGVTPIANAIAIGSNDLHGMSGNSAVILFSDGLNTEATSPVAAAAEMKEIYGDKVCIYTVLLGNDPKGKVVMDQIADAGTCGYAIDINTIGKAQGMDKFVTDVFLAKVMKKPAPVMKKRTPVMKKPVEKISITLLIEFDFDKDVVRPDQYDDAKRIADALKKYSGANALLEGHTDSMGDDAYNMSLSRRRAESVKNYVVEKFNIRTSRISTDAYGESKPVDTNKTDEGRQKNRRVVAIIE